MRFLREMIGVCAVVLTGNFVCAQTATQPTTQAATLPADTIVVSVNGAAIRERDVVTEADHQIDSTIAHSAMRGFTYDEASRPQTRAAIRDDVIHALIERELIHEQLKTDGITITDADVDAEFTARAKKFGQTRAEAEREIINQGKTLDYVLMRLRWNTLGVRKLYDLHATNKKDLSEADARKLYDENPAVFAQEAERRVSRILINASTDFDAATRKLALARAQGLLKRIQGGEDFGQIARRNSDDLETKERGGDRGWSPRGFVSAPGSDPFGDAAFALKKVGDVSGIVETVDGYEIIKLTGIKEARQKPFEEVKDEIISRDKFLDIGNFWQGYADSLAAAARIEWNPIELARRAREAREAAEYAKQAELESHPK